MKIYTLNDLDWDENIRYLLFTDNISSQLTLQYILRLENLIMSNNTNIKLPLEYKNIVTFLSPTESVNCTINELNKRSSSWLSIHKITITPLSDIELFNGMIALYKMVRYSIF